MSLGQTVSDPDQELMNVRIVDMEKPKLFFKIISRCLATSTHINIRVSFNVSQVFDTHNVITTTYDQLSAKREESF
jgi:hypothetical protein